MSVTEDTLHKFTSVCVTTRWGQEVDLVCPSFRLSNFVFDTLFIKTTENSKYFLRVVVVNKTVFVQSDYCSDAIVPSFFFNVNVKVHLWETLNISYIILPANHWSNKTFWIVIWYMNTNTSHSLNWTELVVEGQDATCPGTEGAWPPRTRQPLPGLMVEGRTTTPRGEEDDVTARQWVSVWGLNWSSRAEENIRRKRQQKQEVRGQMSWSPSDEFLDKEQSDRGKFLQSSSHKKPLTNQTNPPDSKLQKKNWWKEVQASVQFLS